MDQKGDNVPVKSPRHLTKNYILNTLPDEDYKRIHPDLEKVELERGQTIYLPDQPIKHVYFPNTSMISVVTNTSKGESIEAGVIGWEGIAGIEVLMGVDSTPSESMAQIPNGATRITTETIRREFDRGAAFHDLTLRYVHALMLQISQTALCNRLHSLEQRLARWLLMCRDRTETDEIRLTQEFLSIMLGVNRPSVTLAAITIQSGGYIKYSRGRIKILNRKGLEKIVCECYQAVKKTWPPA
jgi:CRP-like cAMP-binding protein